MNTNNVQSNTNNAQRDPYQEYMEARVMPGNLAIPQTEADLKRTCEDYLDILQNQGKLVWLRLNAGDFIEVRGNTRRRIKGCPKGTADLVVIKRVYLSLKEATQKLMCTLGFSGVTIADVIFLELKSSKGRWSPEQRAFKISVENQGAEYYLIRSFEELEELFK